ncbi:MAG: YaiI/YqxD family protein [Clostridia bacterium]|nr:YaiI/YqxD family protein [Clostridia bacterium]
MSRILVDADACPVIRIVERVAKAHGMPVTLLCDTNHVLTSDYSDVKVIGAGADAVDFALINLCRCSDIVVTQDYGVAALALCKGAYAIHQSGGLYTQDSIDQMLMERHLARKARMGKDKHHLKGPKKRTKEEDEAFETAFRNLLMEIVTENQQEKENSLSGKNHISRIC